MEESPGVEEDLTSTSSRGIQQPACHQPSQEEDAEDVMDYSNESVENFDTESTTEPPSKRVQILSIPSPMKNVIAEMKPKEQYEYFERMGKGTDGKEIIHYKSIPNMEIDVPIKSVREYISVDAKGPHLITTTGTNGKPTPKLCADTFRGWMMLSKSFKLPSHFSPGFNALKRYDFPKAKKTSGRKRESDLLVAMSGYCQARKDGCTSTFLVGFKEPAIRQLMRHEFATAVASSIADESDTAAPSIADGSDTAAATPSTSGGSAATAAASSSTDGSGTAATAPSITDRSDIAAEPSTSGGSASFDSSTDGSGTAATAPSTSGGSASVDSSDDGSSALPKTVKLFLYISGNCTHTVDSRFGQLRGCARQNAIDQFIKLGKPPKEFVKEQVDTRMGDGAMHNGNQSSVVQDKNKARKISCEASSPKRNNCQSL